MEVEAEVEAFTEGRGRDVEAAGAGAAAGGAVESRYSRVRSIKLVNSSLRFKYSELEGSFTSARLI